MRRLPPSPETAPEARPRPGAGRSRRPGRSREIPFFYIAAQIIAFLSFALGWFRGGHTERFGVGVLLMDYMVTGTLFFGGLGDVQLIELVSECSVALIFIGLALRSDRWWPIVAAAALTLGGMVYFLERVTHDFSSYASESAQLGLWIVIYLALITGVAERWLAGERPAFNATIWRRRRALNI